MRHPLRSAVDLFRSKWWSIGWAVAAVAFALHVAALALAPLSIGQAVLAGGLVFLAVLAERFFGFELGRRQWNGIGLVAVSLALLTLTGGGGGEAHSDYSLAGMITFEGIAVGVGLILVLSHLIERIPVLLGIAAGLGFGISYVAIKAEGSAISPLLANMFMHYAFDAWMAREHRLILFERYCDDMIVHARSEQQARDLRDAIASRLAECGLELKSARPASCTARTTTGAARTSTRRSISSGTRSARDCRRGRRAASSSTSSRQPATTQADAAGSPPLAPAPASGQDHQRPGADL
jgi:multidrug transporter EmrE-like cation transporter